MQGPSQHGFLGRFSDLMARILAFQSLAFQSWHSKDWNDGLVNCNSQGQHHLTKAFHRILGYSNMSSNTPHHPKPKAIQSMPKHSRNVRILSAFPCGMHSVAFSRDINTLKQTVCILTTILEPRQPKHCKPFRNTVAFQNIPSQTRCTMHQCRFPKAGVV